MIGDCKRHQMLTVTTCLHCKIERLRNERDEAVATPPALKLPDGYRVREDGDLVDPSDRILVAFSMEGFALVTKRPLGALDQRALAAFLQGAR